MPTTPEHARIAAVQLDAEPTGLGGSAPEATARRRIDDDVDPIPDPQPDPRPQPVTPSTPDIAFQARFLDPEPPGCFPAGIHKLLKDIVRDLAQERYPDADVRVGCVGLDGEREATTVAVWTRPRRSDRDDKARDLGLERLALVEPDETFGIYVGAAFIRNEVNRVWENDIAKRLNGSGRPDPGGPIHLTGIRVRFEAPDAVSVVIDGYDERPWPDVPFTVTITDTIGVNSGNVVCDTADPVTDDDREWYHYVTWSLTALLTAFTLGLSQMFQPLRDYLSLPFEGSPEPGRHTGPACSVAEVFFRPALMLPSSAADPRKADLVYNRFAVTSAGLFTAGTWELVSRVPAMTISGPGRLSVGAGSVVAERYAVSTEDMRGDPDDELRYRWTAPIGVEVASPTSRITTLRFSALGDPVSTHVLIRDVKVRVTDIDDVVTETSREVLVHVTVTGDDDDDPSWPPLCLKRPWLPECNPV